MIKYEEFLFSNSFQLLLKQIFPEHLHLEIFQVEKINFGLSNLIFKLFLRLKNHSQSTNEILISKFYLGPNAKSNMVKEYYILKYLYMKHFSVPRPLLKSSYESFSFLVMEFISDLSLDRASKELQPDIRNYYFEKMLVFQVNYHGISIDELNQELNTYGIFLSPVDQQNIYLANLHDLISKSGLVEFESIGTWLEENKTKNRIIQYSLVHNDFQPANILIKNNDLFFIDWEGYSLGDPIIDKCWTIFVTSAIYGRNFEDFLFHRYNTLSKSTISKNELEYNFVLCSSWRMVIFCIILNDIEGVREKDPTYKSRIQKNYTSAIIYFTQRIKEITGLSFPSLEKQLI